MIALFTDFGWCGPYVGQLHAVLARHRADPAAVIDLMHDAPRFDPDAAAHLLAALAGDLAPGTIVVGVVDPGVGTARTPVVVEADGRWFVGPGNGLFDVVAARAATPARWWRITRAPERDAATFHGRDLFAPVAAALARGEDVPGEPLAAPPVPGAGADRGAVIYVDGFGNAMTGLRARPGDGRTLALGARHVPAGRTFADVSPGEALWLVNSIGLVEVAVNQGRAADVLGLDVGTPVEWVGPA